MGNIKITCEEATTICTKSQYGEASLVDKLKLNLHFLFCKVCRLFTKQNAKLTDMCKLAKEQQDVKKNGLSDAFKAKLKEQIQELEK